MTKFPFIPYNKKLVSVARELRNKPTEAEKYFWEQVLKDKQFSNLVFLRQKPIGNFILDFYCAKLRLGIEIDGAIHHTQRERDKERDQRIAQEFGINIVRYSNDDVLNNTQNVMKDLIKKVRIKTLP